MKIFIALIVFVILTSAVGVYVFYPVGELAWMNGPYKSYRGVRTRLNYKALAIDRKAREYGRAVSFPGPEAAIEQALINCHKKAPNCELYAIGNEIVLGKSERAVIDIIEKYWNKHATRIFSSPWKGRKFTGKEIVSTLIGTNSYGITRNGLRTLVTWKKKGVMSGEVLNNFARPPRKDIGKWWIQGGQLCRQYENWYAGQQLCGALKIDGEEYLIYSKTGELLVIFKPVG